MARPVQIYHLTGTDTEQVAWCLDSESKTVCIRTPLVFSVIVEALTVENPIRAFVNERSRNLPLTAAILRKFLSERKRTGFRALSITQIEEIYLQDVYFYQGGNKKPYLRVWFASQKGFSRFRDLFQGKEEDTIEEVVEIVNDDDHPIPEEEADRTISREMKQHHNVLLVAEGVFARFRILESDIPMYWHWLIHHGIRAASTVILPVDACKVEITDPARISRADSEYKDITLLKISPSGDLSTKPKILSWDIESLSEIKGKFPNACAIGDIAFFISAYIKLYGDPDSKARRVGIYAVDSLETLGLTEPRLQDGTELIIVPGEEALLDAFWNLIREERPQILLGYNTMGFDSRYLHHRMSLYHKHYPNLSLMNDDQCSGTGMRQFTWSSSAYKAVECWYYDSPGMLVLDLFVELKRSESLKAYTLEAVSEYFLNEHKVDLKAEEMFRIYRDYLGGVRTDESRREMRLIAEYGMQDSVLPARLFDLRTQWVTYTQMASIMGVGIMDLITRGQTLRTKANIYRTCRDLGFVINVPRDKPTFSGKFKGAYVCQMQMGLHDPVIVYDFASLYPSTIAAYNLSYDTFIHPRDWHHYPKDMYNAFEVSLPGSTEKQEVRYVKSYVFKGILPRVVEGFLAARQATKDALKLEKDPEMRGILDKKQLAIKVSNNSVYGAVGADFSVKYGQMSDVCPSSLGLKWIAMTVTEIGQILIKGCTSFLQNKYGAVGIYGDTDSTFVKIPISPSESISLWERAAKIADEFNATLPPPLKIELEKIIRMIGVTPKRYIYRCYTPQGELKKNLNFKGVVATRRDTCKWQVKLFSEVCEAVLQDAGKEQVTKMIYMHLVDLMTGNVPLKSLLIGSSVNESYASQTCRMAILKARRAELGRPIAGGARVEFFVEVPPRMLGPLDKMLVSGSGQHPRQYQNPYSLGPRGGVREDNVSARTRMLDEYVEGVTKIDYAYYAAHMAQKSIDQIFGVAYNGDRVIEPLIHGLRFDCERTIQEMQACL